MDCVSEIACVHPPLLSGDHQEFDGNEVIEKL